MRPTIYLNIILFFILSTIKLSAQVYTLEQCIDTALLHNRSLTMSVQEVDIARERNKEVKSNLIPKLNGLADYRYYAEQPYQLMPASAFGGPEGTYKEVQFGTPHSINASLQIAIPVYQPAIYGAVTTTETAYELSEIQHEKTKEEVILDVATAYFNAQILLYQLALVDSNILNMNTLAGATRLLHQQQMANATDVDRVLLNLERLYLQRRTVAAQYKQVINALKFHMGKPVTDTLNVLIGDDLPETSLLVPELTTDIRLTGKKYELSVAELKAVKNSRLPSISAYGVYGVNGFGSAGNNSFFESYPVSYVGLQVSIPIFNGTATRNKISQAKLQQEKFAIQKDLVCEKTSLDRINAEMRYQISRENLELAKGQMAHAGNIYHRTVLQNQQGLVSINDVLLADNDLREAQQSYLITMVELRKSELEYMHATGNILTKYK